MQYKDLRPSQVVLDPDNPRLPDGTSSDREAANRLLDDGLISLARDLARTGQANPSELPIAMRQGTKYLILEGNRRFAALMLLKDPNLADKEDHRKALRRAANLGTPPKTVHTLVMSSREEADRWIVLRHTGDNDGVGIRRWSASQIAAHRRRANRPVDSGTLRGIAMADELEEAYAADAEIVRLVRKAREEKLTSIGRFFSPDVLTALYFTLKVDDSTSLPTKALLVRHTPEQLRDFFVWALNYILDNPVGAYLNAMLRRGALQSVTHLTPTLADAASEPFRLSDAPSSASTHQPSSPGSESTTRTGSTTSNGSTQAPGKQATGATAGGSSEPEENGQKERAKKPEAKPERYPLQGLRLPKHLPRIQQLLKECRSLDLEEFPGIACVMMRVIVELSVSSSEALGLSGASEGSPLKVKIVKMLRYLDPDIEDPIKRDKQLAQAYMEASELGVQYLHGFVHNPHIVPDKHLARRFSSAFRPLLERVDQAL